MLKPFMDSKPYRSFLRYECSNAITMAFCMAAHRDIDLLAAEQCPAQPAAPAPRGHAAAAQEAAGSNPDLVRPYP